LVHVAAWADDLAADGLAGATELGSFWQKRVGPRSPRDDRRRFVSASSRVSSRMLHVAQWAPL